MSSFVQFVAFSFP
uniref:Uncharacterized protein n=1 Tax=Arundo donax TaxID=35708 RepID=A0A0A9FA80_ARUDO